MVDGLCFVIRYAWFLPNAAQDAAPSDLEVPKMAQSKVVAGQNLTYKVTVGNRGPNDVANVVSSDPLLAGTTFVSVTQTNGPSATINAQ